LEIEKMDSETEKMNFSEWFNNIKMVARETDIPEFRNELMKIILEVQGNCKSCPFKIDEVGCAFMCYKER